MIYNITLKPVTPYFWGMEHVSELGNKRSYYLKSALFPQQTTILGMLRYQVLAQHGLLAVSGSIKTEFGKLIGESSFSGNNIKGYGAIQQITPLQLQKGENMFLLRDKELFSLQEDKTCPVRKVWIETRPMQHKEFIYSVVAKNHFTRLVYMKDLTNSIFIPEAWIEKNEFIGLLVEENHHLAETDFVADTDYSSFAILVKEVIQETGRVGIEKAWEENTKSNAYYKQFFRELQETQYINEQSNPKISKKMMLDPNWKFTFQVKWDESIGFEFDNTERFITMGGEQSVFLLSAKMDENCESLNPPPNIPKIEAGEVYKLLLTSDTYISDEESFYRLPLFVNGVTTRFRNFISRVDTTRNYYVRGERMSGFGQSTPSYLLKRGSMLYFADESSLNDAISLINAEKSFQNIGYNYYKIETEKYNQL